MDVIFLASLILFLGDLITYTNRKYRYWLLLVRINVHLAVCYRFILAINLYVECASICFGPELLDMISFWKVWIISSASLTSGVVTGSSEYEGTAFEECYWKSTGIETVFVPVDQSISSSCSLSMFALLGKSPFVEDYTSFEQTIGILSIAASSISFISEFHSASALLL